MRILPPRWPRRHSTSRARAFERLRLRKLIAHCLETEAPFRGYLLRHGFVHNGTQRDVFYGQGRWHNLDTFSLFAPELSGGH